MRIQRIVIIIVFTWFAISCAVAQSEYTFRNITALDGLPDNRVEGLFFTPDGRLGIRATALISLYDGSKYVDYPYTAHQLYYWAHSNLPPYQYIDSQHRVWAKQRNILQVFDLKSESYIENVDSLVRSYGVKDHLANLFIDEAKRYWFVMANGELQCYDPKDEQLHAVSENNALKEYYGDITGINSAGNYCWIIYGKGFIRCWDISQKKIVREEVCFVNRIQPEDRVMICPLPEGDFWMMWNRGVAYYNKKQNEWTEPEALNLSERDMLTALETDSSGNAWVGSGLSGVYVIKKNDFSVSQYYPIPLIDGTSIHNDITSIAINKDDGSVWISFLFKGIAYSHSSMNKFPFNAHTLKIPNNVSVRCIVETEGGDILLGTADGLYRFDPQTKRIDEPYQELSHKLCYVLYRDSRNRVWVGTLFDGLYCIHNHKVTHYYYPEMSFHNFQNEANYNSVRNIIEGEDGYLWVAVGGGVSRFNPEDGTFVMLSKSHPELLPYSHCTALAKDENGQLIVGSTNGLYYYNPKLDFVWRPEIDAPKDHRFIHTSSRYNYIYCDSRKLYWFGTYNGLNIVDMQLGKVYYINSENGMPNSIVEMIIEDDEHNIWVSTANGICKIITKAENGNYDFDIIGFNQYDGCLKGEYNFGSGLKTVDGTIYFGGIGGFSAFKPEAIIYNQSNNHPVLTGLHLFNIHILPGQEYGGRVILQQSLSYTQEIKLNYDENFVTIEFSGLNFVNPSQTYYRYRLEGFENGWNEISPSLGNGKAVYTGLPHGKYTFQVYTANNDKLWGDQVAELKIVIRPPFWDTIWARIFYLALVLALIIWFIVYMDKRNKKQVALAQQAEYQRRKEELDQMKFRFFTNISHEFRTPLTLIITPLEAFIKKINDENDRRKLSSIHRNALDLLALVNQLLDFRKLEVHGEKLHLLNGELIEFARQAFVAFQSMADEKRISFRLDTSGIEEVYMYFDRDKMHKILNNLLSNAFKFTPEYGTVTLKVEKIEDGGHACMQLKVMDTGTGINDAELPHVFERFYQAEKHINDNKTGSGIGLHLVKEYVELHGGRVSVESALGIGSSFCITIPADLCPDESVSHSLLADQEQEPLKEEASVNDKPLLLVVEDNQEFRLFLREQLSDWYRIINAPDGEEGERLAIEQNPDLIISDIMMPRVDGMELCRRIKTNLQTSHIPVILLTARTSDESKAMGYEAGADSYISKPFSFDVLLTRVRKLIEQQQKRKETFHKEIVVTPRSITITSLDEQLVQKALECVERNIDNTEYSVEDLSSELAMTRATLYRKLQGITGQTPKDFIRSIRLKRAAQLLRDSDLSVSEIADRIGFSTPRYFAKLFKEAFGVLPSQYGGRARVGEDEASGSLILSIGNEKK